MAKRKKSWLKLVGVGCGGLVLLGMGLLGVAWVQYWLLSGRAVETREQLERSYATQVDYTPPLDDAIPSDRLERFLAVRRVLMSRCEEFAALRGTFDSMDDRVQRMEGMEEEEVKEEMKELVGEGGATLKRMFGLGGSIANFSIARNEALISNDMGLGEYTWLYVTIYYSYLGRHPESFPVAKEERPRIFHDRVLGEVREMVRRQVAELVASQEQPGGGPSDMADRVLAAWREEMAAIARDPDRIPFQEGLPAAMEESLAPFREELESLYCPETGELEIMRTEKGTIRYDHN